MTPQEAARVLEPIRLGFLAARLRLAELQEEAGEKKGSQAYRDLGEIYAAEAFLIAREAQWDWAGMLAAVEHGNRVLTWPNVIPDEGALESAVQAWASSTPERAARVAALRRPALLPIVRRLAVPKASNA